MSSPPWEVLVGDAKLLDFLAGSESEELQEHPLQQLLEDIIVDVLDEDELELFWLRFGEQVPYREIARIMGYKSHRTFQMQVSVIERKVRKELQRRLEADSG